MFERPHIKGEIFTDTMTGQYKSLDGKHYTKLFAHYYFFADPYSMEKKILAAQGLR